MIPPSTARIAGSHRCSWGVCADPGNRVCENVALPEFDLCPDHERIAEYLESFTDCEAVLPGSLHW